MLKQTKLLTPREIRQAAGFPHIEFQDETPALLAVNGYKKIYVCPHVFHATQELLLYPLITENFRRSTPVGRNDGRIKVKFADVLIVDISDVVKVAEDAHARNLAAIDKIYKQLRAHNNELY